MSLPEDDDKTVMKPLGAWGATAVEPAVDEDEFNAMPVGSRVAEFEIRSVVGIGGFGIVYLAHDHSLGRDVALKEYLPASLASRMGGLAVSVKSGRHSETFAAGLASFINEARLLAQFDNPSLVKVYRFWKENGTAYMVMPFYEGPTLKQALLDRATPPSEEWLKRLLVHLTAALQLLHSQNYFHRDIAPDNILLVHGERPVLLDFGAARQVIGDAEKALTVILKPGFAPVEQYADVSDMRQGAWTDIYALAAVVHYAITGKAPIPSVSRLMKDVLVPLEKAATGRYSEAFLRGIDRALAVRPEHRPQSIAELRALLNLDEPLADGTATIRTSPPRSFARSPGMMAALAVGILAIAIGGYFLAGNNTGSRSKSEIASTAGPGPQASQERPDTTAVRPPPPVEQAREPTTAAVIPPQVAQSPAPAPNSTARPLDPADALVELFELRDRSHVVAVSMEKAQVRIGKDKLRFRVESAKSGYLYIFMVGTEKDHVNLLFPNSLDQKNRVTGGQPISLPRSGWSMTAGGPPGIDQFVAVVSERPRDFESVGLKKTGAFREFTLETAAKQPKANGRATLAGVPVCGSPGACPDSYGAASFSIEEIN